MEKNKKKIRIPLLEITAKMGILTIIITLLIFYSDKIGYFNPNQLNDHTLRKWNSFYNLTSNKIDIDIMLFGNSHLYTGINPKNLSLALGINTFIFAAPGTNIADSYFGLKEAIKECRPKLVVIETYGMNDFNPYNLEKGNLSSQLVSFSARKNFLTKLQSTPYLFSSDNYLYAWSPTIRNHDYLFKNTEQLKKNKILIDKKKKKKRDEKLYLGRYVRFTSGIEKDIIERYKTEGSPVRGKDYTYSKYTELYVKKITKLCNDEKINLMFLTLPMYEKHISDYGVWNKTLSNVLSIYPNKWLNMQILPHYKGFKEDAFENTYNTNQHMTYNGSLLATYKLADFIRDSLSVKLPNRQNEKKWHEMFYGDEGYFENFDPVKSDKKNKILCSDKKLQNITLKKCLLVKVNNKANKIIAKIDKRIIRNLKHQDLKIRLVLKLEQNGKEQIANMDLIYDLYHSPENEVIFSSLIQPINIKEILDGMIVQ